MCCARCGGVASEVVGVVLGGVCDMFEEARDGVALARRQVGNQSVKPGDKRSACLGGRLFHRWRQA